MQIVDRLVADVKINAEIDPALFTASRFLSIRLLLSCGEASGDLYAGALTRALRAIDPSVHVAGLGGPQFAAAGGGWSTTTANIAVSGFIEWIPKLPRLLEARRRLVAVGAGPSAPTRSS